MNGYYRVVRGRPIISKKGREYRKTIAALVPLLKATHTGRISVRILAQPPDRRKRDLDNLGKSLLDALTHAGVMVDDSLIDRFVIERGPVAPGGRVVVLVDSYVPSRDFEAYL